MSAGNVVKFERPLPADRPRVERCWKTLAGLPAMVVMNDIGFRCGYVGVPADHPLCDVDYMQVTPVLAEGRRTRWQRLRDLIKRRPVVGRSPDAVLEVHGGITFSGAEPFGLESMDCRLADGAWWFGFDCGHLGDRPSPEFLKMMQERCPQVRLDRVWDGLHRSEDYVAEQCEQLAMQLGRYSLRRLDDHWWPFAVAGAIVLGIAWLQWMGLLE